MGGEVAGGAAGDRGTTGDRLFVSQTVPTVAPIAAIANATDRIAANKLLGLGSARTGASRSVAGIPPYANPQRHSVSLRGTWRPHDGHTQLNAGEAVSDIARDPGRGEGE